MNHQSKSVEILSGENKLSCLVCNHDRFYTNSYLLQPAGKTMLSVESINIHICEKCGYMHGFHPQIDNKISTYDDSE